METLAPIFTAINSILWHEYVLFTLVGIGMLFTVWTGFCQFRALTHGSAVLSGKYDDPDDPGAISHFQALSAALSATVGLGNIGGVALAIAIGGPGAVFWMWVIAFFGMASKLTEVTLSMLYRNTDDPDNPHGGPMWVAAKGFARARPELAWIGKSIGIIFCLCLLVATTTGGNMFQAWNVSTLTQNYFGVPSIVTGVVMAILVGLVIIGGIKRIGKVTGRLVPIMVAMYLLAGLAVLFVNASQIPAMFGLIFTSAFSSTDASGAFLGGTMAYAFVFGMKRALFSNEAGQGSSPIAHAAAKTDEPAREGIVAGLEPFIDTIVVCTFTALVILSTGVWNRPAEATLAVAPTAVALDAGRFSVEDTTLPAQGTQDWSNGKKVFLIFNGDFDVNKGNNLHRLEGEVAHLTSGRKVIHWSTVSHASKPVFADRGVYGTYPAASLTALAFDSMWDGLGKYLITLASWMFALSTIISWSYYGEQGIIFLAGKKSVLPYKVVYCLLIVLATAGFIETNAHLDNLTSFGSGVMMFANIPIILIFGYQAMRAYHDYNRRLKSGALDGDEPAPGIEEILTGKRD